jgi:NADH-quinone oxidoreductase subunit F
VVKPGTYEVSLGYPLKDLIANECGGLKPGRKLKAVIPGGSSAPVLTADEALRATMDYECLAQMGSMLGSGAVIVIDDSRSMVDLLSVIMHFYHHESCGQCTPCREGTGWLDKMLHRIVGGRATSKDLDMVLTVSKNMMGRTICALSDAAAMPAISFVSKFRDEFERHIREKKGTAHAEMHH